LSKLKINILASYISQIYIILISLIILPLYMKYMGAEAYGLVGFFTMLQGLFMLLDFGLTPTISRQTAQYNAGASTALAFRQLFRALSLIFMAIAIIGAGLLWHLDTYIALFWLKLQHLNMADVLFALQSMAICVALRWMTGLYRGVISGFEQIVWLSVINTLVATLRFPGALLFMYFLGFDVKSFFLFQLVVAVFEFAALFIKTYRLLPSIPISTTIGCSLRPLKSVLGFALTIAFTSSVWVLLTQLDKFILSGVLTLSDYGYFSLAVLVAGGVLQVSTPVSSVIMPRLAYLHGEQKITEMREVYLNATQFIAVIAVSAGIVLAALAKPILYVWTGDVILAEKTAPILTLYALGNALLALGAFPYYLQYAYGNLKYHFLGNILSVILLIPAIIWAARNYGAIGAGWIWFIFQVVYLFGWVSFVHMKIQHGINIKWFKSFLPSSLLVSGFIFFIAYIFNFSNVRLIAFFQITLFSLIGLIIALLSSNSARRLLKNKLLKRLI